LKADAGLLPDVLPAERAVMTQLNAIIVDGLARTRACADNE
jgi:hypothetical protein